jgi:hypothetical protein
LLDYRIHGRHAHQDYLKQDITHVIDYDIDVPERSLHFSYRTIELGGLA